MPWETRPWATSPSDHIMRATAGGRLLRKRVRITLDPRAWESDTDDANDLRIEGTVLAISSNGPTMYLEEGGQFALIDILVIERRDQ
jgi:hypothetical protein